MTLGVEIIHDRKTIVKEVELCQKQKTYTF
jgi:hypothetical protein